MIKIAVNRRNARLGLPRLDEAEKKELYRTVIDSVYGPTWQGATYSDANDPLLLKTIERYKLERFYETISSDVLDISDVGDIFLKFIDEIDNNTIKTGIPELDENVLLTSSMMVGILGAPSSGKTGFAVNTLEHQSLNNIHSFFMSSDMAPPLFYASAMRRYCRLPFKALVDLCKNLLKQNVPRENWTPEVKMAWEKVQENFKNVGLCFRSGPSIEDIRTNIDAYEQRKGVAVKFFVMDYLEKMQSKFSDPTASTGYNAARLADLTRDKSLNTFLLLQTQKAAGDPSSPLTSMRNIKGASVIEQDCRVVLTTWREGFNPDIKGKNLDDRYQSFACVKNNMGNTGRFDFYIDPDSGLFRTLGEEELVDFERVKQDNINRKIAKANGGQMPRQAMPKFTPNQSNGSSGGFKPTSGTPRFGAKVQPATTKPVAPEKPVEGAPVTREVF
jgi:replicative DNA helicase